MPWPDPAWIERERGERERGIGEHIANVEFWQDPTAHTYPAVHPLQCNPYIRVGISGNAAAMSSIFNLVFDIVSEPPRQTTHQL